MLVSRKTPVILIGKQPLSYSRSPHQNHSPAFVNILNDWFAVVQSRRNVRLLSPGISFLDQSQKLIGYFRSDRISIMLGPINENPFAPYNPQMEIESAYQRRLDNRHQCQGFTKDGCEIVPNIYFSFRISPRRNEIPLEKDYDLPSQPVEIHKLISDSIIKNIVEQWRHALSLVTLDKLFSPSLKISPLEQWESNFKVTSSKWIPSPDLSFLSNLLKIELLDLKIINLRISKNVEEKWIHSWMTHWETKLANLSSEQSQQKLFFERLLRLQALRDFAESLPLPDSHPQENRSIHSISENLLYSVLRKTLESERP